LAEASSVTIVIPAMDESASIAEVVTRLRAVAPWHQLLVIDDGSSDQTAAQARAAGATVVRHPYNKGNGAAVKSGIRAATGDFILVMDGDGQHQPEDALRIVSRLGEFDLIVGARAPSTQATAGRRVGNALLNRLASYLTGRPIPDLTSGFRGARTAYLREFIHLLPNGFSAPTTTTLAFIRAGYNVAFEPIDARQRVGSSHVRMARDGAKFFLILLKIVTIFSPLRIFVPASVVSFVAGLLYGLWTVVASGRIANGAVILLMFAVIVFLVGLVSEQISALRFEGPGSPTPGGPRP
jgi:glycosyltransferase involved in cell wall biosynthesis